MSSSEYPEQVSHLGPKSGRGDRGSNNANTAHPLMPRVFQQATIDPATECWEWTGSTVTNGGYGRIQYRGTSWLVHRATYTELRGAIPDGLTIDHLCKMRTCCNPYHMEVVTQAENLRRGDSFVGKNARKTHCKHGHEYTEDTTAWMRDRTCTSGWTRICAICWPEKGRRGTSLTHPMEESS